VTSAGLEHDLRKVFAFGIRLLADCSLQPTSISREAVLATNDPELPATAAGESSQRQIRGSTLLLAGRCIALAINLAVQIIVVRYFAKEEFGAFAFAISTAALATNLSLLGLGKSLSRFIPIYLEQEEPAKAAGAVLLACGMVIGLGLATIALVFGLQGLTARYLTSDALSQSLLLVLILLAPIDSLDQVIESLFAAFGRVRFVFMRRYLLGPGLKLIAVVLVLVVRAEVRSLALLYVAAGLIGVLFYCVSLWKLLKQHEILPYFRRGAAKIPAAEVIRFSLPLMSSQVSLIVRASLVVVMLEMLSGSAQVAEFRAVFPFARLNEVVLSSFALLYTPVAARMFVRRQTNEINELYWRTSTWITLFSLPLFLVTGVLAQPLTTFLLGSRYANSGPILMILAAGFFVDAVLGFNVHTLRVFAKVRQIVAIDLATIVAAVGLCLALIPSYGALGAAAAISVATLVQNVLCQAVMRMATTVGAIRRAYVSFYLGVAAVIVATGVIQMAVDPPLAAGVVLAASMYLLLVLGSRPHLNVRETFPELLRVPLLGRLFDAPSAVKLHGTGEVRL
jgi:O-antigen/teichoic acid export membrane protein